MVSLHSLNRADSPQGYVGALEFAPPPGESWQAFKMALVVLTFNTPVRTHCPRPLLLAKESSSVGHALAPPRWQHPGRAAAKDFNPEPPCATWSRPNSWAGRIPIFFKFFELRRPQVDEFTTWEGRKLGKWGESGTKNRKYLKTHYFHRTKKVWQSTCGGRKSKEWKKIETKKKKHVKAHNFRHTKKVGKSTCGGRKSEKGEKIGN